MKKLIISTFLSGMVVFSAHAGFWDTIKSKVSGTPAADTVVSAATSALSSLSPEEQLAKLLEKCTTPTTDGICECVANETFGNLSGDQWKILNHYIFDTRSTVSAVDFLIANPWLVTKMINPYIKCSGK